MWCSLLYDANLISRHGVDVCVVRVFRRMFCAAMIVPETSVHPRNNDFVCYCIRQQSVYVCLVAAIHTFLLRCKLTRVFDDSLSGPVEHAAEVAFQLLRVGACLRLKLRFMLCCCGRPTSSTEVDLVLDLHVTASRAVQCLSDHHSRRVQCTCVAAVCTGVLATGHHCCLCHTRTVTTFLSHIGQINTNVAVCTALVALHPRVRSVVLPTVEHLRTIFVTSSVFQRQAL